MRRLITFSLVMLFLTSVSNLSFAQWPTSSVTNVAVTNTVNLDEWVSYLSKPSVCMDDSGGVITCWYTQFNNHGPYEIHASRIDNHGTVRWNVTVCAGIGTTGRGDPSILSDDAGGAIIAWHDWRDSIAFHSQGIYAARLSPTGNFIWGSGNGLAIDTVTNNGNKYRPIMCSDGAHGAVIAWWTQIAYAQIFARHVSANGTLSWGGPGGLAIVNVPTKTHDFPAITTDGSGGAIIAWQDETNGSTDANIFAKRVDASGATVWGGAVGMPVCDTINNQTYPVMISNGSHGAIIAWTDLRQGAQKLYCQGVDAAGNMKWLKNGILIYQNSTENIRMATNGAGGAYITWNTQAGQNGSNGGPQNVVAQLIDSAGKIQWPANGKGISVLSGTQWRSDIIPTIDGKAIICWGDYRGPETYSDIYAQKVDTSGPLWTVNGVAVSTAHCGQGGYSSIASDGCGGALITWMDSRINCTGLDIYAQNINADSTLGGISGTLGCAAVLPPVAAFQSTDSSLCANDCITLTDLSTGSPTAWSWTFQGATPASSTDQNPFVCYLGGGGTFSIKLVVSNSGGADSSAIQIIVVDAPPSPTISIHNDTLKSTIDPSYISYQWYLDSTFIPNATNSYYVYQNGGNYNLRVSNAAGCLTAAGINVLGVNDLSGKSLISISPNPARDVLVLNSSAASGDAVIAIYSVLGEKLIEIRSRLGIPIALDIKDLSKGIYFVRLADENKQGTCWIGKFIKE